MSTFILQSLGYGRLRVLELSRVVDNRSVFACAVVADLDAPGEHESLRALEYNLANPMSDATVIVTHHFDVSDGEWDVMREVLVPIGEVSFKNPAYPHAFAAHVSNILDRRLRKVNR